MARHQSFFGILALFACVLGCSWSSRAAEADEPYRPAKLIISNRPGEHIGGLKWDSYDLPIQVQEEDDSRQGYVELHGTLNRTDENLVFARRRVQTISTGNGMASFSVLVPLQGKVTVLTLFTVDPYGKTKKEKVALVFPDWDRFRLPVTRNANVRRLLTSVGMGFSDLHYQEPSVIDMNELAITGKFNAAYRLDPNHWELGGNAFFTLLPVPISIPSGQVGARWYGVNGRIAYRLPIDSVPSTKFWVMTGWYLWGMIVNAPPTTSYGLEYLGGPQLFVNARITPAGERASWIYLKYADISNGVEFLSVTDREYALGGGREISEPGSKHPCSLTVDVADMAYNGIASNGTQGAFHLFSASLGFGVGL